VFTLHFKNGECLLKLLPDSNIVTIQLSPFYTNIPENTQIMWPSICPRIVWFRFIHTASDLAGSV